MDSSSSPVENGADPGPNEPETLIEPPTVRDALVLFGRYQLLRSLGKGGMGLVVLAHDTRLGHQVALKILPSQIAADPAAVEGLKKEVLRGMALTHPGIVRTHNFEQDDEGAGIVMEFIDGRTLAQLRGNRIDGCFAPAEIEEWVAQLCAVLDYAHREARIVHRDLKPGNILVAGGEFGALRGRIKVADFGLSAILSDSVLRHSREGILSGTPPYMSPQQAHGEKPTHLDDIYSLGATIYELLTSRPPFYQGDIALQLQQMKPPSMTQRRMELGVIREEEIPPAWEATVAACLAKDPSERPQSAGDVLRRLRQSEAATVDRDPKDHPPSPTGSWRIPSWVGTGVVVAVAIATGAVALHRSSTFPKPAPPLPAPAPAIPSDDRAAISAAKADSPYVNGIGMKFVPVPVPRGASGPTAVSATILFATAETTVAQYERFARATGRQWPKPPFEQGPDHPAVNVTWEDAVAFCAWLTQTESAAGRLPPGTSYRLPTDHEWSCAAGIGGQERAEQSPKEKRGAIEGVYPWGKAWPPPAASGNYADASARKANPATASIEGYDDGFAHTCPVEAFPPNPLGLYGLGGNASEWCADWFDAAKQDERTLRGGCWADADELYLRSSFRASAEPAERFAGYGFRCVLAIE